MPDISWVESWWRRHLLLGILTITVVSFAIYRTYYYQRKPLTNSKASLVAHGIVEGRINELRIKHVLLRFPAGLQLHPYTDNEIVPGHADSVTVDLDFRTWLDPQRISNSDYIALVPITINSYLVEHLEYGATRLEGNWKSVFIRTDLGLRECVQQSDDGGWGYRIYIPLDPEAKTPRGGTIIYTCAGRAGKEPDRCRTRYQHSSGLSVQYYLSSLLLSRWREVHTKVVETVDAFIVR